jgi:hypothetical protein
MEHATAVPAIRLPISDWTVRVARGADDRPALEVYEGSRMADVCVATPVSVSVLRGAWRNARGAVPWALAWGQLPPGTSTATARFSGTGRNPSIRPVPALIVEGAYWIAEAAGDFAGITVQAGPALISGRLRRARPR